MSKIFLIVCAIGIINEMSACVESPKIDCSIRPEKQLLEPIEQYHNSEFKLVATHPDSAIVSTPDGNQYEVVIGSRIGSDFGSVIKIEKNQIVFNEIVSTGMDSDCDGKGSWLMRTITIQVEK